MGRVTAQSAQVRLAGLASPTDMPRARRSCAAAAVGKGQRRCVAPQPARPPCSLAHSAAPARPPAQAAEAGFAEAYRQIQAAMEHMSAEEAAKEIKPMKPTVGWRRLRRLPVAVHVTAAAALERRVACAGSSAGRCGTRRLPGTPFRKRGCRTNTAFHF